jgi:branched-chain amino acid transport system ATP-binding protein
LTGSLLRSGGGNGSSIKEDLEQVYDYFPPLKTLRKRTSGYLSGGEQQMMVIGRALMSNPKVMLLDEPSLGLAPMLVQEIFNIIQRINQESGVSILLVEQNAKVALEIASYAYVMETGRIVLDGPAEQLAGNADIREFYLGLTQLGERKSYREVKHYKRRKRWLG